MLVINHKSYPELSYHADSEKNKSVFLIILNENRDNLLTSLYYFIIFSYSSK